MSAGGVGDAEGVDGGAFFCVDACVGDFEAEGADGAEDGVEEADAVDGLDVDGGGVALDGVGDPDAGGEFVVPAREWFRFCAGA